MATQPTEHTAGGAKDDTEQAAAELEFKMKAFEEELLLKKLQFRSEFWKWIIGTVGLAVITAIGTWTFQYFNLELQKETTRRELSVKERDMQLQYLKTFTATAIDEDIGKRIRLAHYIMMTIDKDDFPNLAERWKDYYDVLSEACKNRSAETPVGAVNSSLLLECSIGGLYPGNALFAQTLTARDIQNLQASLCVDLTGIYDKNTQDALATYLSIQGASSATLTTATWQQLLDLESQIPDCKAAGYSNVYELAIFGASPFAEARVTSFQGLLQKFFRSSGSDVVVPTSGKLDIATRTAISEARIQLGLKPGREIDQDLYTALMK
jgi:hypothetical protein